MLQIIGFGEVVMLEKNMTARKEMRVVGPDGVVHGVEVTQDQIKQLLGIWAGQGAASVPRSQPVDEEPDVGEMAGQATHASYADNVHPDEEPEEAEDEAPRVPADNNGYPVRQQPPKPKFLMEDDDGNQI